MGQGDKRVYVWDLDYPKDLQGRRGQSVFKLVFDLTDEDRHRFRDEIGSKINDELPIEISIGRNAPSFRVIKRGPGAQALTDKSKAIARFIGSRLDINHIEAVRKAGDAHAVVDAVVSRALSQMDEGAELKEALATIARVQQPILDEIQRGLTESLRKFLPSVEEVIIRPSTETRASALRSVDILINDGQSTPLAQKGDGVISLTALALLTGIGLDDGVFSTSGVSALNTVLAIEEPESHLHPTAIHYIRQVVDNIASDKQIIITTHSPLLVNRRVLSSNIIVEGNKATVCSDIRQIRTSLGIRTSDNLSSARVSLLCEGTDDVPKLVVLMAHLKPDLCSLMEQGELAITPLGGASKLPYNVTLLQNSICDPVVLLDNDVAGREAWQKCRDKNLLSADDVFFTTVEGRGDAELEDLLDPAWLNRFMDDQYGVDFSSLRGSYKRCKFSDRLAHAFSKSGKPIDDIIKAAVKSRIALEVERVGPTCFDGKRLTPVKALLDNVSHKMLRRHN